MLIKEYRMRTTRDYNKVYKYGKKIPSRYILVFVLKSGQNISRFGFVTSKKVGNAVTRNKIKRRLRAVVQKNLPRLHQGYDLIIIARNSARHASAEQLEKDLMKAMQRAGAC